MSKIKEKRYCDVVVPDIEDMNDLICILVCAGYKVYIENEIVDYKTAFDCIKHVIAEKGADSDE